MIEFILMSAKIREILRLLTLSLFLKDSSTVTKEKIQKVRFWALNQNYQTPSKSNRQVEGFKALEKIRKIKNCSNQRALKKNLQIKRIKIIRTWISAVILEVLDIPREHL